MTSKSNQVYETQVLGCDQSAAGNIKDKVDAFLYIGDGNFHPLGVALKTKKPVFCFNPITEKFIKIKKTDIAKIEKRKKANYLKFLSSDNIGILVSTKPGQQNLKKAIRLKKKMKNKKCYILLFDTLNVQELENFPFIQSWVNTACPRISDEKNIINIEDIKYI